MIAPEGFRSNLFTEWFWTTIAESIYRNFIELSVNTPEMRIVVRRFEAFQRE